MDPDKIQNDIDALLTFMNDDMERIGGTITTIYWSFAQEQEDRNAIEKLHGWSEEHLFSIINRCHSRGLLKNMSTRYARVALTEEGQSRALSVKHGKDRSYELARSSYTIGAIHVAGSAQVGDGNTQNIYNVFQEVIDKIDRAEATPEEKAEAKSLLTKFLEHPLTSSVVGGVAGSLTGLL
ncbi:TPA: hypothetical protein PFE07_002433 [Kluyvera cryocrescens]|uniref:hypothetical protein n=1 Tax=Kluyvera cryocrescens TaxID=580 RepID=UPI00248C4F25|nr:hypothetical protein [Kluyvera cryocrescens]HDG1672983.1 hypothetical protein [Kluyvera cryocrescens]